MRGQLATLQCLCMPSRPHVAMVKSWCLVTFENIELMVTRVTRRLLRASRLRPVATAYMATRRKTLRSEASEGT